LVASANMELLPEFARSCSPDYNHGTPVGVQHPQCADSGRTLPACV